MENWLAVIFFSGTAAWVAFDVGKGRAERELRAPLLEVYRQRPFIRIDEEEAQKAHAAGAVPYLLPTPDRTGRQLDVDPFASRIISVPSQEPQASQAKEGFAYIDWGRTSAGYRRPSGAIRKPGEDFPFDYAMLLWVQDLHYAALSVIKEPRGVNLVRPKPGERKQVRTAIDDMSSVWEPEWPHDK